MQHYVVHLNCNDWVRHRLTLAKGLIKVNAYWVYFDISFHAVWNVVTLNNTFLTASLIPLQMLFWCLGCHLITQAYICRHIYVLFIIHAATGGSICTIIRAKDDDPILLSATFFSPVAGTIFFRQSSMGPVSIFGKLYYVTDMEATFNQDWHVHEYPVNSIVHLHIFNTIKNNYWILTFGYLNSIVHLNLCDKTFVFSFS